MHAKMSHLKQKNSSMLNEKGFTLLEMIIVILIISVLLLLIVPNLGSHKEQVSQKSKAAFKQVLSSQVALYELERGRKPTLSELERDGYLTADQIKKAHDYEIDVAS